jgi:hypothetical protein
MLLSTQQVGGGRMVLKLADAIMLSNDRARITTANPAIAATVENKNLARRIATFILYEETEPS